MIVIANSTWTTCCFNIDPPHSYFQACTLLAPSFTPVLVYTRVLNPYFALSCFHLLHMCPPNDRIYDMQVPYMPTCHTVKNPCSHRRRVPPYCFANPPTVSSHTEGEHYPYHSHLRTHTICAVHARYMLSNIRFVQFLDKCESPNIHSPHSCARARSPFSCMT